MPTQAIRLPAPASDQPGAANGVHRALARLPASCLERSLIRQRWHAARGHPRDLVIGRGPVADYGAHAWLDGDLPDPGDPRDPPGPGDPGDLERFHELRRWPPPATH